MPRRLLVLVACLLAAAPTAAAASLSGRLAAALAASSARTGALVVDLASGRVVFAANPTRPLVPASNEKLPVTYAALRLLGPSYRMRTEVLGEGHLEGSVWRGDLVLKGYGDPTLSSTGLAELARQMRALGIRRVTGALVGDDSFFDRRWTAPGWKRSFVAEDSAPLSALVVDRCRFDGHVTSKPALAATILFRRALAHAGVTIVGRIKLVRAGGFPLAAVFSPALADIVRFMDQESDNFTAELLLKQLGAVARREGTTAAGAAATRAALAADRVPLGGVQIADGSGLSSLDRLTPAALVTMLSLAWHDRGLRPFFAGALAVAGRSGTLEHRLRRPPARGNVRAKTGTTELASALSGYVRDRYAFAVLENGRPVPYFSARTAQDRFVTLLAAQ